MKKRDVKLKSYCDFAQCELCRVERCLSKRGQKVKEFKFQKSLYANLAIVTYKLEVSSVETFPFAVLASQVGIAHLWGFETYGLTALVHIHEVYHFGQIISRTRIEVDALAEVGSRTLAKLDKMLKLLGWWYKQDAQGLLFCPEFPALEIR